MSWNNCGAKKKSKMVAFGQLSPDLDKDFAPYLIIERIRI